MAKPEAKSYTLSHYGAKYEDSSPVEVAYEPKSHAAILEGWEGNHVSTSAGTINQAGNAVARTMLTTIMSDG